MPLNTPSGWIVSLSNPQTRAQRDVLFFPARKGCGLFRDSQIHMKELSSNPEDRLGVYKCIDGVPTHHRLHQHAEGYRGRDVWKEYVEETNLYGRYDSARFKPATTRAVASWKTHVEERGRHHALATPADVNTWCTELLASRNNRTVYNHYWTRLAAFYEWLRWHTAHPHTYDPFLMAAHEYTDGAAGRVWAGKVKQ